jgi:hypothetical protein
MESEPMVSDAWVSPGEVLVHIGIYKTGTTSIQERLEPRRAELATYDVYYPGRHVAHNTAAMAVLQVRRGWREGGRVPPLSNWDALVDQSHRRDVRTIVSSEVFCIADDAGADRIVSTLGQGRTKILITLRPLEDLLPSSWQEYVKSGLTLPYDTWVSRILDGPGAAWTDSPSFWSRNDFGPLVERWATAAGAENVTVMPIDKSNPSFLYRQFEELVGLPESFLARDPHAVSNRSMSAEEAELIRALNERVRKDVPFDLHRDLVRNGAVRWLVEGRRPGERESSLTLTAEAVERARELHRDVPDRIRATGVRVVGDLSSLTPTTDRDGDMSAPTSVPVEVAALMLEGMLRRAGEGREPVADPSVTWRNRAGALRRRARRAQRRATRAMRGGPGSKGSV